MRLDLAAFRELEAFAQLGTDLDAATQARLDRGRRMVEILKQPQFKPLHVVDQVAIIFAAANGHLDDVEIADVRRYEEGLLAYLKDSHGPFREKMVEKPTLDDGNEAELDRICAEFTRAFLSGDAADPR